MACSRKWAVGIISFSRYYMPCMIGLGLIGNLLCVLIFLRTKLNRLPVTHFLIALSVADSGVLLISLLNIVADPLSVAGLCHALLYANNVLCFLSVWLVVSFTSERYIAIKYPLLKIKWNTINRSRVVILILCGVALLWNSYILIVTKQFKLPNTNRTICITVPDQWLIMNIINYADSMITLAIPFLIIALLNISITRIVIRRRLPSESTVATMLQHISFSASIITKNRKHSVIERLEKKRKDEKVTKTLLLVSLTFLCMNLPDHVLRVFVSFLNNGGQWVIENEYFICGLIQGQMASSILFQTNFAINFLLYSMVGDNFRTHMMDFFRQLLRTNRKHRYRSQRERLTSYQSTAAYSLQRGCQIIDFV